MQAEQREHDVVIVGGGPAGCTAATLLKKYNPDLNVVILEKEKFPRDHVGESQLPATCSVLHEMEAWEKVEAAGFPVKIGATFTWGASQDRWDIDFYPVEEWTDEPRPAKYAGQRQHTAFQVDRAVFDDILLRHAETLGTIVREQTQVRTVHHEGDRITSLELTTGEHVTGRYYLDCSGSPAVLRRGLGIESVAPKELRNIAIWDYWENADWAIEIGVGATRIQVRSLPWGWIWFIPLGPTRTSVGLVCPANYYKDSGKSPTELYMEALRSSPDIWKLLTNATATGATQTCSDWSHLAERLVGENWFLCGESAGFADPILSAGMTLAHSMGRDVAYTILELDRGEHDPQWLRQRYNDRNRDNINQHIRFAQYWYSANSCFTDLQEHCQAIAAEVGVRMSPQQAWRWLAQGGFSTQTTGNAAAGSFDIASAKQLLELFDPRNRKCNWLADGYNVFELNLHGAEEEHIGVLSGGRIQSAVCYRKGDSRLPMHGTYALMVNELQKTSDAREIFDNLHARFKASHDPAIHNLAMAQCFQVLEALIVEGWVIRRRDKKKPALRLENKSRYLRFSNEASKAVEAAGKQSMIKSRLDEEAPAE